MTTQTRWVSALQFLVITINAMVGSSLIILPRTIAETAKQDMWLAVLVAGGLFALSFRLAAVLAARFPKQSAIEYHCILLGRFTGNLLNIAMIALMLAMIAEITRIFRVATKIFLLDTTPSLVIVLAILLLSVYAAQNGLGVVIRVQQFMLLFSYSTFLLLILLGLLEIDTQHFTPILADGIKPVLLSTIDCWTTYSGPELIIGLIYPYITQRENVIRYGLAGIGTVIILFVLISGITLGILGANETANFLIPTIMAYRSIEIPDTFIERIDGYLMIFWIAICFSCLVNWLYFTGFAIARMIKLESSRPVMVLLIPLITYLVSVPPDFYAVIISIKWINYAGLAWALGIVPVLLGIAWWREWK